MASVFTPRTIAGTSPFAGAETITLRAPPARCRRALSASVKRPVDSMTTSAPTSPQGMSAGSRCAKTRSECSPTTIDSPSTRTPSR